MTRIVRLREGDACVDADQIVGLQWWPFVIMGADARVNVHLAGGHTITEFFGGPLVAESNDKAERRYLDLLSIWQDS